jgi:hypothetical protein
MFRGHNWDFRKFAEVYLGMHKCGRFLCKKIVV